MSQRNIISRRQFLKKAGGACVVLTGFPYIIRSSALGKAGTVAPSNRITVACIGVGPEGHGVMRNFLAQKDARVLAVCDVKTPELEFAQRRVNNHYQNNDCKTYRDFRPLLAREDIDVVLIATPDHWHVLIAVEAAKAGKDIFLEKPIGLSVAEALALRNAVHKYGTVFLFGTQQRSNRNFRLACELVRNGRIGKLHTVNVWCPPSQARGSTKVVPVPQTLDYDKWLGPAPYSPYTLNRCSNSLLLGNPYKIWPFISDYCLGWISGWGIHPIDIAQWGAGTEYTTPVEIEGKAAFPKEGPCDTATQWTIKAKYENGLMLNFVSEPAPQQWQKRYKKVVYHGTAFEGTDGWVHVSRSGVNTYPENMVDSVILPEQIHLYKSNNHVRNLLDCVKTREKTISNIDVSFYSDLVCQISAAALHVGRKLTWDTEKLQFKNDDAANRFILSRPMRSPWHL